MTADLPNRVAGAYENPNPTLLHSQLSTHRPWILLLYGSLREWSYSRFLTIEAARLLETLGADTKIFDPSGLPLPDDAPVDHPKVQELRNLSEWSEGQVLCSPERHGEDFPEIMPGGGVEGFFDAMLTGRMMLLDARAGGSLPRRARSR